jgi:hypothetical protein
MPHRSMEYDRLRDETSLHREEGNLEKSLER